jgi:ATP-dependent Clp protease ATP-binding subunit ClpX
MTTNMCYCGHCGKSNAEVKKMTQMHNSGTYVCDECAEQIYEFMHDAPAAAAAPDVMLGRTPKEIVAFMDQYIVGQTAGKRTLALAVSNHYKRLNHKATAQDVEIQKSNVLLLGPTGTGKTLLAQTIARMLNVPFVVANATSLTQSGYVGDDVETIIQGLVQAAGGDIDKAERGIVFIDEIDKLAKASTGASITRDVGGEGVQQALLKLIEGDRVRVPVSGSRKHPGEAVNVVDTTNILFVCAGAFVGLLDKLTDTKKTKGAMGFLAEEPKAADQKSKKVTPEMVIKYGMIPEFVGRLPVISTLTQLDVDSLERILTEPKNAVVRQMEALFAMESATLTFEEGAIRAVAERAHALKTGARGARTILEELLEDAQFEVPGSTGAKVTVKPDLTVAIDYALAKAA